MTTEEVAYIIRNWSPELDTWQGDVGWLHPEPEDVYHYPPPAGVVNGLDRKKWRELPEELAEEARRYIGVITTRYPLQLRALIGLPLWLRFCDVWSDTGQFDKAMRAI